MDQSFDPTRSVLKVFFSISSQWGETWYAATTGQLYQPQMIYHGDCGAIGGKKIGRGNRSTRRKCTQAPLCSPQIPHDQTQARTKAIAVGSQRLTT
jgi:hypothetical protein